MATSSTHHFPTFEALAAFLEEPAGFVGSIINDSSQQYARHCIPKRNGTTREIAAPSYRLKRIQRRILESLLLPTAPAVHLSVHGFVSKRSIKSNALPHAAAKEIFKTDIRDFFASIPKGRVAGILANHLGLHHTAAYWLASLCCLDNRLPQGAPTSPMISNLACRRLDARLSALARGWQGEYTRYADDITISGRRLSGGLIRATRDIVLDEGFALQEAKTRLIRGGGPHIITGLSAKNPQLRIPRSTRRVLRKDLFFVRKFGLVEHALERKSAPKPFLLTLLGRFEHWRWVEPHNSYATEACVYLRDLQRKWGQ